MAEKKKLGRGLSALLGDTGADYATLDQVRTAKPVAIELLHPGRYQPRHYMNQDAVEALADSIRAKGILQPLLVRRHPNDPNAFEIIAGERRWRAAQLAKLHEVPVIIKDFDDKTTLEVAVVENVQREDLSAIEEADAYQRLMDEFDHTQEDVSALVGKSRSHVANTLRLLGLEPKIRKLIEEGLLSAGHARTLIGVEDGYRIAQQIIEKNLSVREAEEMARKKSEAKSPKKKAPSKPKDVDTIALERDLTNTLGLGVTIDGKGEKGALKIAYENLDQLDMLIDRLRAAPTIEPEVPAETTPPASVDERPKLSVSLKPKSVG
jgi:ParB family chromosome partitioning protein